MPQDHFKNVTYDQIVCDCREVKEKNNWTRLVVRGDLVKYTDTFGTPRSDLLPVKPIFNSIIPTSGA